MPVKLGAAQHVARGSISWRSTFETYWDDRHGELVQLVRGYSIDQSLAQWHAVLYGLGGVLRPGRTRTATSRDMQIHLRSLWNCFARRASLGS